MQQAPEEALSQMLLERLALINLADEKYKYPDLDSLASILQSHSSISFPTNPGATGAMSNISRDGKSADRAVLPTNEG